MSNTLLPCPFCGGKARWRYRKPIGWVMCKKCGASSATLSDNYEEADCQQEAIAAWNRRVDARQLALKTRVCPMCEDCPDGCPVETPKDSRNIVTNADRIRSMSDEELARQNVRKRRGYCVWTTSDGREFTSYLGFGGGYRADEDTIALAVQHELEWLQQPVKEE